MFYYVAMFFIRIYLNLKFKIKIIGKENVLKDGGVIFCSNHLSNYDSILVCSHISRKISYFAKKELFNTKFKNFFMHQLAAFPVDRDGTDMNALKHSIKLLKGGGALGIFAQGTRAKSGESIEAKNGVSLFALRSEVPVIPIGITAEYGKKRGKVIVRIGKPISFDKYKGQKPKTELLTSMTQEIVSDIEKLIKENEYNTK